MEQSNKAAAMWVDFTRDIVLDSQRHEDSISWAVVEGDSYSTTEMSYFQQVARKNAATSL